MDLVMSVLRELLSRSSHIKVVLMSSTINPNLFSHYFDDCPVVILPDTSTTLNPIETLHLEEILSRIQPKFSELKPKKRTIFGGPTSADLLDNEYKNLMGPSILQMAVEQKYSAEVLKCLCLRVSEECPANLLLQLVKNIVISNSEKRAKEKAAGTLFDRRPRPDAILVILSGNIYKS